MLETISDLPLETVALVICGTCVGIGFVGVIVLRPVIRAFVGKHSSINTVARGLPRVRSGRRYLDPRVRDLLGL